jgi:hypothetical protein
MGPLAATSTSDNGQLHETLEVTEGTEVSDLSEVNGRLE